MYKQTTQELLLTSHQQFHIEYGTHLTNHMHHGLIALSKLEASSERLKNWYNWYSTITHYNNSSLEKSKDLEYPGMVTLENWKDFGVYELKYFQEYFEFFMKQLTLSEEDFNNKNILVDDLLTLPVNNEKVKYVINTFLPTLMKGIYGSAFHPFIHLGYALNFGESNVAIAEALAYLVYGYFDVNITFNDQQNQFTNGEITDLLTLLNNIRLNNEFNDVISKNKTFTVNMNQIKNNKYITSTIHTLIEKLDIFNSNLDTQSIENAIIKASTTLFYGTKSIDFFVLHGVTASGSLHWISKWIEDDNIKIKLYKYFILALVNAYIIRGRPSVYKPTDDEIEEYFNQILENDDNKEQSSWEDIISLTIDTSGIIQDEHQIKLIYNCYYFANFFNEMDTNTIWFKSAYIVSRPNYSFFIK